MFGDNPFNYLVLLYVVVQKLDFHWHHTKTIQTACEVLSIAWNLEGLLYTGQNVLLGCSAVS